MLKNFLRNEEERKLLRNGWGICSSFYWKGSFLRNGRTSFLEKRRNY